MKRQNFVGILLMVLLLSSCTGKKNYGLVLSGGGAKGAYEVGCWKALKEYGITNDIKAISGSSVGALNAALFSCVSEEEAENLWKNEVGYYSFLMPDNNSFSSVKDSIAESFTDGFSEENEYGVIGQIGNALLDVFSKVGDGLLDYAFTDKHAEGMSDRTPLSDIINRNISIAKINKAGIKVYATCLQKNSLAQQMLFNENIADTFLLNEQKNDSDVRDILLASSALPGIYPSQTLSSSVILKGTAIGEQREYIDGGFEKAGGDNTPVSPIISDNDIDTLFIVYLKSEADIKVLQTEKRVINIVPSQELGVKSTDVLNFSEEQIQRLIDLGYDDTCKVLAENGFKKNLLSFL